MKSQYVWTMVVAIVTVVMAWGGVAIQFGSSKAKIEILERQITEIKTDIKDEFKIFNEQQRKIIERLGIIQGELKNMKRE